jgi:hypothetical protein
MLHKAEITDIAEVLGENKFIISVSLYSNEELPIKQMSIIAMRLQEKGYTVNCRTRGKTDLDWPRHPEWSYIHFVEYTVDKEPRYLYEKQWEWTFTE